MTPESIKSILCEIELLLQSRENTYRRQPVEFIDMEILENQIIMKAYRMRERLHTGDKIDELRDIIGYSIFALQRLGCGGERET
jgi:hypothetical protein